MKSVIKYKNRKELLKAKRKNAKLYVTYKMFSWDLLFFYSIQYLFLTMTKGISPGDILKINALYPLFTMVMQMPAIICGDILGRKKSIVMGNMLISLYVVALMVIPSKLSLFIGNIIWAFGYALKNTQETNLLYDSTSTKGGEGLYPKINGRGATGYYILDGIASLTAGYLFVINAYLPMLLCLGLTLIATLISLGFKDIYKNDMKAKNNIEESIKEYKEDFKYSIKAIIKSKRLRALIIFLSVFNAINNIMETYRGNILTKLNVSPENFSIIIASITLIAGFATIYQNKFHKKYRNKSLGILAIAYVMSMIAIGCLVLTNKNEVLPLVLILLCVRNIAMSLYYILAERYLKNFSTPKTRGRISFASETVTNIIESACMFGAGIILDITNIGIATLWTGLLFLAVFVVLLDYMRTRVGLKPNQYEEQDIDLEKI